MTTHLIKLAVGIEDIDHLRQLQAVRAIDNERAGLGAYPRHYTRQRPKREAELLDGGSIYWVIKGYVRARQRIRALENYTDDEGKSRCAMTLDPELVATRPLKHRAFQGWRYLDPAKAPPDLTPGGDTDIPVELSDELGALGLL